MKEKNTLYWYICILAAVILTIITFTPLVIPKGVYRPLIGGLPRTLWVGIVVYICFVVVTYIATRVHPKSAITKGDTK